MPKFHRRKGICRVFAVKCLPIAAAFLCIAAASCRKQAEQPSVKNAKTLPPVQTEPAEPTDIPVCSEYRLCCAGEMLYVYDDASRLLYRTAFPQNDILTARDRAVLERDGYIYTSRSELVEFLLTLETPHGVG